MNIQQENNTMIIEGSTTKTFLSAAVGGGTFVTWLLSLQFIAVLHAWLGVIASLIAIVYFIYNHKKDSKIKNLQEKKLQIEISRLEQKYKHRQ